MDNTHLWVIGLDGRSSSLCGKEGKKTKIPTDVTCEACKQKPGYLFYLIGWRSALQLFGVTMLAELKTLNPDT